MYCTICTDDDHTAADCQLRASAPRNEPALLAQHAHCHRCTTLIYAWDHYPCGQHQPVGVRTPPGPVQLPAPLRPPRPDLQALALQQAAEARAARMVFLGDEQQHDQGDGQEHAESPRRGHAEDDAGTPAAVPAT